VSVLCTVSSLIRKLSGGSEGESNVFRGAVNQCTRKRKGHMKSHTDHVLKETSQRRLQKEAKKEEKKVAAETKNETALRKR
jgi:predicted kinase